MRRWALIAFVLAMAALSATQSAREVHLFVPCGMIVPFNRLKAEFERQTQMKLRITYDNGVALVRRIREKGERPDILVAHGRFEQIVKGMDARPVASGNDEDEFKSSEGHHALWVNEALLH